MKDLTDKQFEVLLFISNFSEENSFPPTLREIAENFQMTMKGAYDHTEAIIKKKFLKKNAKASRSLVLTETGKGLIKEYKKGRTK